MQQSAAFFPVFRTHRTAVRLHDGHTYRQADAHIAPLVGDLLLIAGEIALKQVRQKLLLDAAAVVRDLENSKAVGARQAQLDPCGRFAMLDGIFHQIDQHLLNENDIHRDHKQRIGRGDADLDRGIVPLEFHGGCAENLFSRLQLLFDIRSAGHTRDGQQIFHHADEPVGFVAHIFQQISAGFR